MEQGDAIIPRHGAIRDIIDEEPQAQKGEYPGVKLRFGKQSPSKDQRGSRWNESMVRIPSERIAGRIFRLNDQRVKADKGKQDCP